MNATVEQMREDFAPIERELPEGWALASFMDVFDIQGGTQPPKKLFVYDLRPGYVRLLQIRDFGKKPFPTYVPLERVHKTCLKKDILIGRYGASVGRICTGMEGAYNVALTKIVYPDCVDRRFLFHLLNSEWFQAPILAIERSAQNGFNKDNLADIHLPFAPIHEQQRIGARLDILDLLSKKIKERLERVPRILGIFQQAVLAAACSGELTVDWRIDILI